ncbi:MAG TPA: asparagine synthase (glutamine-hydrolyzing) [Candidatus Polarisedimenticolia bacterium]|jgi:asparagine synthase (glutamine-hydrolysing)
MEAMLRAIDHRGPDDRGFARLEAGPGDLWLGSTRLAIIDLSAAGHMPMGETGSKSVIVYNGEIYGFQELRRELEAAGEGLSSRTDTEVILRLYRREGARCLQRLRGMFAFAIWDAARSELFLARDRAGKKPLYYCEPAPGIWAFASEVRALLAGGFVERRLDPTGLEVYLANGYTVSPRTLVRGIRSLLPGHFMRVSVEGRILEAGAYWRPPRPALTRQVFTEEKSEEGRQVFQDSVALRLISDVPLGVFLSGGMDSSAIVGAVGQSGTDLRTFSIRFREKEFDESEYARKVASFWKTRHTEVDVGRDEFFAWLPDALAAMDQPTFDGVNTYFVSRAARRAGLKVALSGLGADELFGGYPFLKAVPHLGIAARVSPWAPGSLRGALLKVAGRSPVANLSHVWKAFDLFGTAGDGAGGCPPVLGAYQVMQTLFPSWSRRALLTHPQNHETPLVNAIGLPEEFVAFVHEDLDGLDRHSAMSLVCWRLFLGERCLRDTDSMSMGVSLEVRAPFTDHLFVEQMLSVPGRTRCAGIPEKPFEGRLLMPWLKGAWTPRPKQGFIMPFREWLGTAEGEDRMQAALHDRRHLESIGLSPPAVAEVWRRHRSDPIGMPWSRVWTIFVLSEWCRMWSVSL